MSTDLHKRISQFYDQSTDLWLDIWGEHMHHGYYPPDSPARNHQQAQIRLIEEALSWADIAEPEDILDAGCGVGGSARYLARKYGAHVLGVNISSVQIQRARALTSKANLGDQVAFAEQDLLSIGDAFGPYDLVWSMENAEHIAPKEDMLSLFYDRLRPGGRVLMITWCTRDTFQKPLTRKEEQILEKLCRLYHLPPWISLARYEELSREAGFRDIQTADWSAHVAPFWGAVIRSALSVRGLRGLAKTGLSTIRGAWAMRYMQQGYRSGLIRFGLLQATKP
jgi:tocopherol O-methyltransferase